MVELYINNSLCDLTGSESISVDYTACDITKIGTYGGARSYTFSIPKTNRNKQVLQNPEIINNASSIPYSRLPCLVLVDGVDVQIRFCEIESAGETYSVRVYGANSDLFAVLKDLTLWDLDLSMYDHFWTQAEIVLSLPNTEGSLYPIIDYQSDSPNIYIDNVTRSMRSDVMLPATFINTILEKIIEGIGYTLTNEIADDTVNMIVSNSGLPMIRNKDGRRYESTFSASVDILGNTPMPNSPVLSYGYWIGFDTVNNADNNYGNYWEHGNFLPFAFGGGTNIFLRFAERVRFTLQYDLTFAGLGYDDSLIIFLTTNFSAIIDSSLRTDLNTQEIHFSSTTTDFNAQGEFTFETDYNNTWLSNFDDQNCLMMFCIIPLTLRAGSFIKVKDVTVLEDGVLKYVDSYQQMNYCTVAQLLPDMTQADFLKSYLQQFCLVPVKDDINNVVSLKKFSDLLGNVYQAKDWSNKLDYTFDPETKYVNDAYAQNSWLRYTQDSNLIKPVGTDYAIQVNNKNLEFEKDIITIPFAGTSTVERLIDNNICQVALYKEGKMDMDRVARLLNVDRKTIGGNLTLTDLTNTDVISDPLPVPYFIDSAQTFNLGFADNIVENYFTLITQIMQGVKISTVYVRLTASDISVIDFSIPIWIDKYEAYFYISSIKGFTYTENRSTMVELVKLNING